METDLLLSQNKEERNSKGFTEDVQWSTRNVQCANLRTAAVQRKQDPVKFVSRPNHSQKKVCVPVVLAAKSQLSTVRAARPVANSRQSARTRAANTARNQKTRACAARPAAGQSKRVRTRAARPARQQSASVQSTVSADNAEPRVCAAQPAGNQPASVVKFVKSQAASSVVKGVLRRKKKVDAIVVNLVKV